MGDPDAVVNQGEKGNEAAVAATGKGCPRAMRRQPKPLPLAIEPTRRGGATNQARKQGGHIQAFAAMTWRG